MNESTDFIDYLLKKESTILTIHNDCTKIEISNQQMIKSNDELLNQIDKSLNNQDEQLSKTDKINDGERIEQFYKQKDDLFTELIKATKFYDEQDPIKVTNEETGLKTCEQANNKQLKSALDELERCEKEIKDLMDY